MALAAPPGIGRPELKAIENDAQIESSFRRLLSSVEAERDSIRGTWQQIEQDRDCTTLELERLRQDTEEWCYGEKQKIDQEWRRLDKLSEKMSVLWPEKTEILSINCRDHYFMIPRTTLRGIEGSNLDLMFSDKFIQNVPCDADGRFYIDFNPHCFALVVEYLQNRRLQPNAPAPVIPCDLQGHMDLLADALKLKPFLRNNRILDIHSTSLQVTNKTITATHPGWQVIAAKHPLRMANVTYFEVKVLANPDTRGGLAVGICGHIPQEKEVHSIRLTDSVIYNSHNGIVGDAYESEDVYKGIEFSIGSTIGVKNDIPNHCLTWYLNRSPIGKTMLKRGQEKMRNMYPVFALYVPNQKIYVEFDLPPPAEPAGITDGAAT